MKITKKLWGRVAVIGRKNFATNCARLNAPKRARNVLMPLFVSGPQLYAKTLKAVLIKLLLKSPFANGLFPDAKLTIFCILARNI